VWATNAYIESDMRLLWQIHLLNKLVIISFVNLEYRFDFKIEPVIVTMTKE
jgi:hypothetical protein